MIRKRKIEVFSAGCPVCKDVIDRIKHIACASCDVSVLYMKDKSVANHAKTLGIRSVPAIVIDGKLADCCRGKEPDETILRGLGLGQTV